MQLDQLARDDIVYDHIEELDGRGHDVGISTSLLRKLPNLKIYNGAMILSVSSDVNLLRRLTWDELTLYINDTPFNTQDLKLAIAGGIITQLILGSMIIKVTSTRVSVENYDPNYGSLVLSLVDEHVHTLEASVDPLVANYLPANVKLLITQGSYWTYSPSHPLVIRSTLIPPQPQLHSNIVGLDVPLPADLLESVVQTNPTLTQIGIDGSTVRSNMNFDRVSIDTVWVWSDNAEVRQYVNSIFS